MTFGLLDSANDRSLASLAESNCLPRPERGVEGVVNIVKFACYSERLAFEMRLRVNLKGDIQP